jgi:hypothetical protein
MTIALPRGAAAAASPDTGPRAEDPRQRQRREKQAALYERAGIAAEAQGDAAAAESLFLTAATLLVRLGLGRMPPRPPAAFCRC